MFRGSAVPTVTVDEVAADAFILDVREDDEWMAGHVPDAVHMPMTQIPGRIGEIPDDRDVVVVCRVGGRSAQVVAYLQQHGLSNTVNLDGGMSDWAALGRPMVSEDGGAARVI